MDRSSESARDDGQQLAGRIPVYPIVIAAALLLTLFNESIAAPHALPRPLLIALIVAVLVQLLLTFLFRDPHVGALAALAVLLSLGGLIPLLAVLIEVLLVIHLIRRIRGLDRQRLPWRRLTGLLNVIACLALLMTVLTGWWSGAYPIRDAHARAANHPWAGGPDVYLIMLDGYPRADTLANIFRFDNSPFLQQMDGLGFEAADNAHSNYNITALTLATMFNGSQARDVESLHPEAHGMQAQFRSLSTAIYRAAALDGFRDRGYEIVSIPSPFTSVELSSADRNLDSGGVNEFEASLLITFGTRHILGETQSHAFNGSLRARMKDALTRTSELAAERNRPPKFVFTHVMSPHAPILWTGDGQEIDGFGCFPTTCSIWATDGGEALVKALLADQVEALNRLVMDTIIRIQDSSATPPVIVLFSDHGIRYDYEDHDEMFRSLFLADTPGKSDVFPDDVTPVNIIPRLLNAYYQAGVPLATEESYLVDMRAVNLVGPFPLPDPTLAAP